MIYDEYRNPRPNGATAAPVPAAPPTTALAKPTARGVGGAGQKFLSPAPQAPQILLNQVNPTSAAMVANGRNPANPIAPPINAPAYTTSPGAAPRTNGVPFAIPPDPIQATTSPGAAPAPAAPAFSGDPMHPAAQRVLPNTIEAPPKPIIGGPTIPGTAPPPVSAPATPTKLATPPPSPSYNTGRGIGAAIRGVGPAIITGGLGALLGNQTSGVGNPADQTDGNMPVNPLMAQIPTGGVPGAGPTPATQPYNAFTDTETGRNLSNIASAAGALPGLAVGARTAKALSAAAGFGVGSKATIQPTAQQSATPSTPVAAPGASYPETAGMHTIATPANPAAVAAAVANPANPNGQVTRIGNSYSGAPGIRGDISINGKAPKGGFVSGTGDGTFTYGGTGGGTSGVDAALHQARLGAIQRGDVDAVKASYGGDFGPKTDAIAALINNGKPMTTKKAAAIAALQNSAATTDASRAKTALDAKKAGTEAEGAAMDNKAKARLGVLQDALFNAKTPKEQAAAEDKLRAFQGKYEKAAPPEEYGYAPGGQEIDPATGATVTRPGVIFNKRTGEVRPQAGAKAAPEFVPNKVYVDAKGNRAKWDGKQFVPA